MQVVREGWARPQDRLAGSRVWGEVEVETWCFGVDLAEVRGEEEWERWWGWARRLTLASVILLLLESRVWVEAAWVLVRGGGSVAE